jgi:glycosyltransferase involved in cell wall biosynthesis
MSNLETHKKHLCVIAPARNEESGINVFIERIEEVFLALDVSWSPRLILIDDGSTDSTWHAISRANPAFHLTQIKFSRNFGHQAAVWAGLENAREWEHVVVMDSDLQDSPSEIHNIIAQFEVGMDCIFMRRRSRKDTLMKRIFARLYYLFMKNLSSGTHLDNVGDFFGLSPRANKALLMNHERIKYIRGLVSQLGYRTSIVEYDRDSRFAGNTNYTLAKMFSLAIAGVTGFSVTPLLWTVYFAAVGSILSVILMGYVVWLKIFSDSIIQPGWAFLSVGTLLMSTFSLTSLATISLYLGRIIQEVKHRPLFYIDEMKERESSD